MHTVALDKIRDVIGADAVLYVMIEDWGQKYIVMDSYTVIKARAELVDVASGEVVWRGNQSVRAWSGGTGGDPIAMLIAAAVTQVLASVVDTTHDLSKTANAAMVSDPNNGLLTGPYHPKQESDHCLRQ